MKILTDGQINQLNMHSVYLTKPNMHLFRLDRFMNSPEECLEAIVIISGSPNKAVGASYFMRRWGMFISMQLYMLASDNIIWEGNAGQVGFGVVEEYGLRTIGTFVEEAQYRKVEEHERKEVIKFILHDLCFKVIKAIRQITNVSPLTLWENIFGYLIWHYHVLSSSAPTAEAAKIDLDYLRNDKLWEGFANGSLFAKYLNGKEPSMLLNTPVRKSCCFSKDVPGLMKCTYCPLP